MKTTKPATLFLPAITETRAARIEAAHSRHAVITPAVIRLFAICESELLTVADQITSGTLNLLSKGGNPITLDLNSRANRANDWKMNHYGVYWDTATASREEHAAHRETAQQLDRIANRITSPDDMQTIAAQERDRERVERDNALSYAQDIERMSSRLTHSDRADLVQAAAAELLLHGKHSKAPAAAVRKAVRAAASGNAYIQTRTEIIRPATEADRAKHTTYIMRDGTRIYEPLPHITRKGTQDGETTIEHRAAGKWRDGTPRAEGDYIIHRRRTAPARISFEEYTENGNDIADNGGINAIQNQSDREAITALMERANLNQTERAALLYVLDNITAANVLYKADKDGETDETLINRLWREALRRAGVLTKDAQTETRDHITAALSESEKKRKQRLMRKLQDARRAAETERIQEERQSRYIVPTIPAAPTVTYTGADHDQKPTEYATYTVQFVETINPADLVTVPKQESATRATTPAAPTAAEFAALARLADRAERDRAELPREERRAAVLATRAAEAQRAAEAAQEAANAYSKTDRSEAARAARTAANRATEEAQNLNRRAREYARDVEYTREFIARYSK